MSKNQQIISGPLLAVVIFGGSYLARKGIGQIWSGVSNDPLPKEDDNAEVEVVDAIKWAVVSGLATGLIKFAIRRANYRGNPLK